MNRIYLDNAATMPLNEQVYKKMLSVFESYGNPSSVYQTGREARKLLDKSREHVAKAIGALPSEIYFTSGGTEADNWAIIGAALEKGSGHIITSSIEHHAVLHTCAQLEKMGFEVSYLPVDSSGLVSLEDITNALKEDTFLISVMYANNEIGTIQPISEIAKKAQEKGILFHCDAVQAVGHLPLDVKALGVDMLSLSAHKFGGPKGVGALYIKKGTKIANLINGGAQERGRRAGTENVAGIVGLAEALRIANDGIEQKALETAKKREYLTDRLFGLIPNIKINGNLESRLPGVINITFKGVSSQALLIRLDRCGVAASAGSACTSGSLEPSHVLKAIGLSEEDAKNSIRLSLSNNISEEELYEAANIIASQVQEMRGVSGVK
ncbi:MAG: cysteine desulfurase family protein [Eubacteriales bacterium]|nr:cysteine desulfurase family protein [Eubacteriales bacterium]